MSSTVETKFKTDDMALVTYLRMNYITPDEIIWDHNTCWWFFEKSTELSEHATLFVSNEAQSNPKEFSRQFKLTRQEFHAARPAQRR